MKKQRLFGCILGLALCAGLLAACTQSDETDSDSPESRNTLSASMESRSGPDSLPDQSAESEPEPDGEPVTREAAGQALRAYYPEGVELAFSGERSLHGKPAYVFAVTNPEGELVSRAAMTVATGAAWYYDIVYGVGLDEDWRALGEPPGEDAYEPYLGYYPAETQNGYAMFDFAHLDNLPEFPIPNVGHAAWNAEEQTLSCNLLKWTGTETGAPGGPVANFVVSWATGGPVLESAEFTPAANYSYPAHVLGSGELITLEDARMLELAQYFYDIIQACEAAYPDADSAVRLDTLDGLL